MSQIIKNKIILVLGKPGTGKTFFVSFLASFYLKIYSNVDFYKGATRINDRIRSIDDVNDIGFNNKKGVVVLDESGININSRRSMSNENQDFAKLGMLGRKKNVDIIIIGQLKRSIDVYFRELASYIFDMRSYFIGKNYLNFEAMIENDNGRLIKNIELDLIKFANLYDIKYDTKEESILEKKPKPKKLVGQTFKKNVIA